MQEAVQEFCWSLLQVYKLARASVMMSLPMLVRECASESDEDDLLLPDDATETALVC